MQLCSLSDRQAAQPRTKARSLVCSLLPEQADDSLLMLEVATSLSSLATGSIVDVPSSTLVAAPAAEGRRAACLACLHLELLLVALDTIVLASVTEPPPAAAAASSSVLEPPLGLNLT